MRIHQLALLLLMGTYGCASIETYERDNSLSFDDINSICMVDGNTHGCKDLDGVEVSLIGVIDNSLDSSLILSPNKSFETSEDLWRNSVQIAGTQSYREKVASFEGQTIRMTGTLHSSCVEPVTEANSFNESQDTKSDDIIVRMLTGTCHYINNRAFFDATIEPFANK